MPRFRLRLRCARSGGLSSALEPSATQRASVVSPAIGVASLFRGLGSAVVNTVHDSSRQTRLESCWFVEKQKGKAVVVVSLRQTVGVRLGVGGHSANAPANRALNQPKTLLQKKLVISRNVPGGFPLARYAGISRVFPRPVCFERNREEAPSFVLTG